MSCMIFIFFAVLVCLIRPKFRSLFCNLTGGLVVQAELAFPAFFFYPYAQFFEELGEHVAALLFENPSGYFYLVVEGGVFQDVEDGSCTAGFGGSCSL